VGGGATLAVALAAGGVSREVRGDEVMAQRSRGVKNFEKKSVQEESER
jgi:hypothetical protein